MQSTSVYFSDDPINCRSYDSAALVYTHPDRSDIWELATMHLSSVAGDPAQLALCTSGTAASVVRELVRILSEGVCSCIVVREAEYYDQLHDLFLQPLVPHEVPGRPLRFIRRQDAHLMHDWQI